MGSQSSGQGSILAVTDVSAVGRCAALAAVPVLSLSGSSCALLPTAFFSAHTGGFGAVYRRDMTQDMEQALAHWAGLGLRFDAVLISYVAGHRQLALLEEALPSLLAPGGRLYVDPVMGDQGRRYAFCGEELLAGFRRLCARADVIFPNRTEAALLQGLPVQDGQEPAPPDISQLAALGAGQAVVTGAVNAAGQIGVLAAARGQSAWYETYRPRHEGAYPGTGDLLAACMVSALERGARLPQACEIACDFLDHALQFTQGFAAPHRFGLAFEPALPRLAGVLSALTP